ncbi:hypothetical protein B0A48_01659 [Cryoendolithus antarcticus]|uniref:AMP-dependent synthetase/ligase domain-containing protein n=1 Tax=Cryoendolithus antarcticus TaxID=1507870 RepID=A0A1V8TQB3_9PEZI|nr:hypothetical protein B0A48_01659 [Cryoendolithus antarcticus]
MPFLAKEHHPIPTKDLLSWTFDDQTYDQDDPIYIDALKPSNNISSRQARKLIRQLVAGFHAAGLQQGDVVNIHSFNSIWYPIFLLGVVAAGGVFSGTNPAYTPYELSHALKISKARFVLVQPDLIDGVLKASREVGLPEKNIVILNPHSERSPPGYAQWSDLLQHGEQDWVRFDNLETTKNTTAAMLFTSGTTGLPKAAMLSHYNLVAQHTLVYEAPPRPYKAVRVLALPMFHAAMAPVAHTTPLRNGEKGYVLRRFDLEHWMWTIQTYKITDVGVVPPIAIMAINSELKNKMSETSCIATRLRYPEYDTTGSVGYPLPNIDLKLVDDYGADISEYDVRGELCIRGPTVIRGYFENEEANNRDFDQDGFFHTGDIAYVDKRTDLFFIVDRKKELIKVRGFQVVPPELEGVLLSHPNIVDAAVYGVSDPVREGGELPRAHLVRRPGASGPSDSEVHAFMREKLASFKMLEGGIKWVDAIPKNASGKILKRILREDWKKESGAKL